MTPAEIKLLYDAETPILAAWGGAISDAINKRFKALLKMEVAFRVKTVVSSPANAPVVDTTK